MLIFVRAPHEALILQGLKTTTIRLWKTTRLRRGDPLSFNGRVPTTITRVESRVLRDLTDADALAAGYFSRAALRRVFCDCYPTATLDSAVIVLHFRRRRR